MASFATINDTEQMPPQQEEVALGKRPYRSYKKKFLKLRHAFRDGMREGNALYEDEMRGQQIARRLQEQNDQLLELLLDLNESQLIPDYLRYDLRSPSPAESAVPDLEPDDGPRLFSNVLDAQAALQEARTQLQAGTLDPADCQAIEAEFTSLVRKGRSLNTLSKTSHTTIGDVLPQLVPDLTEEGPTGYFDPTHEEEFLASLDAHLDTATPGDPPFPRKPRPTEREKDREMQLRNPMSVYNWLTHHRPRELVGSFDDDPDKPARAARKSSPKVPAVPSTSTPAPSRATKKEKVVPKQEEEILDDDGTVIPCAYAEEVAPKGGKRKRTADDDVAYRPKGGGKKRRRTGGKGSVSETPKEVG